MKRDNIILAPSPGGAIVLGLLLDGAGPRSGYDLQKQAAASVGHFWPITKAHVYAELPKLEAAGLVTGEEVRQAGLPDKRLYVPTKAGQAALARWLEQSDLGEPKLRHPLLLKVFFAMGTDGTVLAGAVDAHETRTRATLARYRGLLDRVPAGNDGQGRWRRLAIRHGILRLEADLAWLEELTRELQTGK